MFPEYDVIVVGGGHAGCEAAHAAAKMGSQVLLITMNLQMLGTMSCNPAMGGIGKGQNVREIDALGGLSGIVSDKSLIQFRMLNKSKGPGMWSPRTQNDRMLFAQYWREELERCANLSFWQDTVKELIVSRGTVVGVITAMGQTIHSKSVVLTNGTFLNGIIHIGRKQFGGGRIGEKSSTGLTEQLVELGFKSERLKTGTPPRVDGRTLNYDKMEKQEGDDVVHGFSYLPIDRISADQQRHCWITYTSTAVHNELREGFKDSPMFNGDIQGSGPRYCPSIEDKINRFADKDQHQLFIEPEGWNTVEIYVNGFSTSLPEDVQHKALQKVPGFEQCKLFRPGYAIEYDFFPPTQLTASLETKLVKNLFFAGQINGTTGYEEAACQGLLAGINAHNAVVGAQAMVLGRDEAYMGVLVDDLINKGTDEPYRMFTSRAEFRTLLRQDNADMRLTKKGHQIGLASDERLNLLQHKELAVQSIKEKLSDIRINPEELNAFLEQKGSALLQERTKMEKVLLRPGVHLVDIIQAVSTLREAFTEYTTTELEQAEIQVKYGTYIQKEKDIAAKMQDLEGLSIPESFDYNSIVSLGTEAKQKLTQVKPRTLGQASRISGINPTDVQILMVYMGR
jgi:tRNA uridine 5-carboxymethylaminomethyl modification enzyme